MSAKRTTAYRVMMTLVLLVSALLGMAPLPAPRAAHAAPTPPPGSWPFYRYDMQRTNRVPPAVAKGNITQPAIKWTYLVGGMSQAWAHDITGPNGVPDGVPEIIAYGGGRVRAFNSQTGDPLWTSDLLVGLRELPFVGDVDGDGRVEVLAQAYGGTNPNWRVFVLSGATGQVRSQVSGYSLYIGQPVIADADGDGKMELFEGNPNDSDSFVFSFKHGADNPVIVGQISDLHRVPVVADFNGDSTPEVLVPTEDYPTKYRIINPATWGISSTAVLTGIYYVNVLAEDVLTSSPGREIVAYWTPYFGTEPLHLSLHKVGPAPSYAITQLWARSVFSSTDAMLYHSFLASANLDGAGDREIIWSYYYLPGNLWCTEIINASNGTVLASMNNRRLCGAGGAVGWKGGTVYGPINLDGDAQDELLLCEVTPNLNTPVLQVWAYDWVGGSLVAKWSRNIALAARRELISNDPHTTQRIGRFAADFDLDGGLDVLAWEGGALKALRGVDGTPVYTYTPPVNVSLQYLGDLDGNLATPEVVLSGADGYLYYLDRTLNLQRRMYAGVGSTDPYVVDTNGDLRNEVIFQEGTGALVNLDAVTATQRLAPRVNWRRGLGLPGNWHPLNLDGAGLWEFLTVDASQAPTYTLNLVTIDPANGATTVLGSGVITNAPGWPVLHAVGQFDGSGADDVVVGMWNFGGSAHALAWTGRAPSRSSGSALTSFMCGFLGL